MEELLQGFDISATETRNVDNNIITVAPSVRDFKVSFTLPLQEVVQS